ncbi:MAG: hypothetical protein OEO83_04385 [Alphaproteobacteria bacterium]|nr:hypothetical protein [Alphaproteobacteria bacterium]
MRRLIVPVLLGVLLSGPALAIDSGGSYVGRFNYSCPQVLELHGKSGIQKDGTGVTFNRSFSVIVGWMAGYMSSINAIRPGKSDFFGNMADEAGWIAKWCEANQKSDLMEAMEALTKERTAVKKKPKAADKKPVAPVRKQPQSDQPPTRVP